MKKRVFAMLVALVLSAGLFMGCSTSAGLQQDKNEIAAEKDSESSFTTKDEDTTNDNTTKNDTTKEAATNDSTTKDDLTKDDTTNDSTTKDDINKDNTNEKELLRIGGLKGPTTIGLVQLLDEANKGKYDFCADFQLAAAADELTPLFLQGELDLIAVPANLASVLYNKTEGKIRVLAVNTLGVLSIVDSKGSILSIADLKDKTILATGQGTTPEYVLRYLLKENGLDPDKDVNIAFKSEATEVVSAMMLSSQAEVIAMLPQPFVTVAQTQMEDLRIALDLNEEWNKLSNGSKLVTGVLIAKQDFVDSKQELVGQFLDAYEKSCDINEENLSYVCELVDSYDIVQKNIAMTAIPKCNITFLEGSAMKDALRGYLSVLYEQQAKSVGGLLPGDDFYYERQKD